MKILLVQRLLKQYNIWRYRGIIVHSLFWLMIIVILVIADFSNTGWPMVLYKVLIDVTFYIVIIYFNLLYLIPKYLSNKQFILYCILMIVSVLVLTPIKIMIQFFLFNESPDFQLYVIKNQSIFFLNMFLITASSSLYSIISDWVIHQREKIELESQTMQSELNFLRSQINPHFLFNTLNNLYALTLKKSDAAPEIVLKLSEMMRYMLYECNEKKVLLSKEVAYLQNYLDLERIRQRKNVDIKLSIEGHILQQRIAPLIFVPFVENSFKHGLNSQIDHGFVHIELKVEENSLDFKIKNSKAPIVPRINHSKSGGIGLVNVRRRLNLLYPDQYKIKIWNDPNTYTVKLTLSL